MYAIERLRASIRSRALPYRASLLQTRYSAYHAQKLVLAGQVVLGAEIRLPDPRYKITKCSRYGQMHDACIVWYIDLVPGR